MPVVHRPAIRVFIDYQCDECGTGYLRPTEINYPSGLTEHQCTECGVKVDIKDGHFPRLIEIPKDE